jgi:AraC family transcriptional regulator, transcriptional activator of pobA
MATHNQGEMAALTLVDPQTGNLAFKVFSFVDNSHFDHIQRLNYYSLIWIKSGTGKARVDFAEYSFAAQSLFAFTPYQPFMLSADTPVQGIVLNFHPDFYCIHRHQDEVACNGVLFNNIYQPPLVAVDEQSANTLDMVLGQIRTEMQNPALAQYELLISYLKIMLITASRLKTAQQADAGAAMPTRKHPFILQQLKEAIEVNFRKLHAPGDYASMLFVSPKTLARITKTHFNKTLSSLINERIIIEAKRELYLTGKTVKEIAYELGYEDEYYFSRFFKVNAEVSPQGYRETVGVARADA